MRSAPWRWCRDSRGIGKVNETPGKDLELCCITCGDAFVLSSGERSFFTGKNLSLPKRCSPCRKAPRSPLSRSPSPAKAEAICSACGLLTLLPFNPDPRRPIYCDTCFKHR